MTTLINYAGDYIIESSNIKSRKSRRRIGHEQLETSLCAVTSGQRQHCFSRTQVPLVHHGAQRRSVPVVGPMKGVFPTPDASRFFPSDTDIQTKITGLHIKKAYTSLGTSCPNAYTKSYCCLLMHVCISMEMSHNAYTNMWWYTHWGSFPQKCIHA